MADAEQVTCETLDDGRIARIWLDRPHTQTLGSEEAIAERGPGPAQHLSFRINGATRPAVAERVYLQEWHYFFETTRLLRDHPASSRPPGAGVIYARPPSRIHELGHAHWAAHNENRSRSGCLPTGLARTRRTEVGPERRALTYD
ncbi:hypothetical protein MDOR_32250 [Mycolicibacterium doricum]|uniref:Uncharacterized protein n=1 Tax=Mycolicibacterium doricum TaxID=126673 RepID=A0A1X1TJ08_9MYCO|nr:hypothetical protein AWC01_04100 [Mycolicibacterium doricum]BBZ09056.1 hypothetical protein MDOR_32250 [Mycolicibacterium doricum]